MINYTQDQVEYITNQYRLKPDRDTVEKLAEELDKSVKSIIGKLAREGVYKKTVYKTKTGENPVTKKELVQMIAELMELPIEKIAGLEKSPKADLKLLAEAIQGDYDDEEIC